MGLVSLSCAAAAMAVASSATSPRQSRTLYSSRTLLINYLWLSVNSPCTLFAATTWPHSRLWIAFHACVLQALQQ